MDFRFRVRSLGFRVPDSSRPGHVCKTLHQALSLFQTKLELHTNPATLNLASQVLNPGQQSRTPSPSTRILNFQLYIATMAQP